MVDRRARPRRRSPRQLSSGALLICGVLFVLLVVELLLMHSHTPTHQSSPGQQHLHGHLHGPSLQVLDGLANGNEEEQTLSTLPGKPSVPDFMALPSVPANSGTRGDDPRPTEETIETKNNDIASLELPPRPTLSSEAQGGDLDDKHGEPSADEEGYGDMRVAVLVPYSGSGLPIWFDAFTDLAAANKDLVDWIIFCEEDLARVKTPENVRMITTPPAELAWMLAGVVYPSSADEHPEKYISDFQAAWDAQPTDLQKGVWTARATAARFIQKLLQKNPYYMVEFKPALGWVFRDYLKDYSHWAYGDLDVFFGDLTKGWLEPRELREYDVITYSFGDQQRAYLRGQLTIHKSTPKVNGVWRHCQHLSHYLRRIKRTIETQQYNLESAEGCYSMALMYSKDIKAKYAVKVFTDMPGGQQSGQEEVIITGDALVKRCPHRDQRRGDEDEPDFGGRMQVGSGEMFKVERQDDEPCEYWINPSFQTCLDLEEGGKTNIFLIEGQYYGQGYDNLWTDKVEEGCSMGAFHHFQEFKASYRAWNTRPPMPPIHKGMVAGNGGLVPLPNGDWHSMAADPDAPPPENYDRFTHRYCLKWNIQKEDSSEAKFSCDINLTAPRGFRTLHDSRLESVRGGALTGGAAVTLGGVGGFNDLPRLLRSCQDWEGPKVLVLAAHRSQFEDVVAVIRGSESWLGNALIVCFFAPISSIEEIGQGGDLPTKALLNSLGDLCQTRHLLTLPPGFRVARGTERAVVAALKTPTESARVFIVPQWCLDPDPDLDLASNLPSPDIEGLRRLATERTARLCLEHELASSDVYFGSQMIKTAVKEAEDDERESGGLTGGFDARHSGEGVWRTRNGVALLRSDTVSPAIVVDMWSAPALFLRHIEESCRSGCYDGAYARGLWAAGFSFEVLPGAAVFSDTLPTISGPCPRAVTAQMKAYSRFLQDIRRVYSRDSTTFSDNFNLGSRTGSRSRRPSGVHHPFGKGRSKGLGDKRESDLGSGVKNA